jgi:catechol 2,3-dioxygenase-like lactoylglutathione lyase family enzyme
MLDHITLYVNDFLKMRMFYLAALSPLGYEIVLERENVVGLGIAGRPEAWIRGSGAQGIMHIALRVSEITAVDAFYSAALKCGGKDNGVPGIRRRPYITNYAAFVLDPEGNNIEVVCDKTD